MELSEPSWVDEADRRLGPRQSQRWLSAGSCIGRAGTRPKTNGSDRFVRYNARLRPEERSLVHGLREVRSLTASLELPAPVAERAAYWFRTATSKGLLNGRSIEAMCAGVMYIAARERELPITKATVAERSPISEDRIRGHVGVLQAQLSVSIKPATPQEFLPKLASELSIADSHERQARELLEAAVEANVHVGKHPAGVAGAAIYTTATNSGRQLTQTEVAEAAGVSSITICRRHQQLQNYSSKETSGSAETVPST